MKRKGYLPLLVLIPMLLLSCSFEKVWDLSSPENPATLPKDEVSDVSRSYSSDFTYETLLPVELKLTVQLYESSPTPGGALKSLPAGQANIIATLRDGKGNLVYSGRVQADGRLESLLSLPAAPDDMVLALHAAGYQERSVTIKNMVGYATVQRTMGLLSQGTTAKSLTLPDSDGDLVPDVYDAFPNDPTRAFSVRIPADGSLTIAFEDLYLRAQAGDADYNDFLARYHVTETLDAQNNMVQLDGEATAVAKIAGYNHLFGIVIDFVGGAWLSVDYKDSSGSPLPGGIDSLPITDGANILLFLSSKDSVGRATVFSLVFDQPRTRDQVEPSPYDPYLFVYNTGYDIHLIGKDPLPGSRDPAGTTFQDAEGFPWALLVPADWQHPAETQRIEIPYPEFTLWRQSFGAEHSDWYLHRFDPNNHPPYPVTGPTTAPVFTALTSRTQYYQLSIQEQNLLKDPDGDQVFFRSGTLPTYMHLDETTGLITIDPQVPRGTLIIDFWSEDEHGADTSTTPYTVTFTFRVS